MPALTPIISFNEISINRNSINESTASLRKFPHSIFLNGFFLKGVPVQDLRRFLENAGLYIEQIDATNFFSSTSRISMFGSRFCLTPRLKELEIYGPFPGQNASPVEVLMHHRIGDMLLLALDKAPALELLNLCKVSFSCPETVEWFFANSKTLKTLRLNRIQATGTDNGERIKTESVAHAFRKGLQRNQTLTKISIGDSMHGALLQEVLWGVKGNENVNFVRLDFDGTLEKGTALAIRCFLEGTVSVKELLVFDCQGAALVPLFQGLTSNKSVKVFRCQGGLLGQDLLQAGAIRECFENNESLRTFSIRPVHTGGGFGPKSQLALVSGLAKMNSLESFTAHGSFVSSDVLEHIGRLDTVDLRRLESPDWTILNRSIVQKDQGCRLRKFSLCETDLSFNDPLEALVQFLSLLENLKELRLSDCGITAEGSTLIADLIRRKNKVKVLHLFKNSLGTEGARIIMEATRTSPSMEELWLGSDNEGIVTDDIHETLRDLLMASGLKSFQLDEDTTMGRESVVSLSNGLRQKSTVLKRLFLPHIDVGHVIILGKALVENDCLEHITVVEKTDELTDANDEGEHSVCHFLELLPRMKGLKTIRGLFDCKTSDRLQKAVISGMRKNTTLDQAFFISRSGYDLPTEHLFSDKTAQYFLELNRLHRGKFLCSIGNQSLPSGLLPLILARMTKPWLASHLFYFLRHGAGLLLHQTTTHREGRTAPAGSSSNDDVVPS